MAIEFLRFGSSIPGAYWGCCDCCIIQNFKTDPDSPCSIQLVTGDSGGPIMHPEGGFKFAGKTEKEIFLQRLRYGTFSDRDMPNHVFFAVLTESQINIGYGAKWLKILKEEGFEYLFSADNSVYSGENTITDPGKNCSNSHLNHYFALIRNIGRGAASEDRQFTPPKAWDKLPDPYGGDMSFLNRQKVQLELFNKLPKDVFYTEKELIEAKVPITYAGVRSEFPQEDKTVRDTKMASKRAKAESVPKAAPFAA